MAPIKLKLSLSSATQSSSTPSTPSIKLKLPSGQPSASNGTPSHAPSRAPAANDDEIIVAAPATQVSSSVKKNKSSKDVGSPIKTKTAKARVPQARPRPSAIPSRLLSSAPSTPKPATPSLPPSVETTPTPSSAVKEEVYEEEDDDDPLAGPISPSAVETSDVPENTPLQEEREVHTPETKPNQETKEVKEVRGRSAVKWQRTKKPLKELVVKVLVELRRKDEYLLFEEPVDTEVHPDYFSIIGGEDKMMSISIMQRKNEDGEYRSMDEVEADLWKIVNAAQKFNPPLSIPFSSAARLLGHGLKHINRSRPIVRTPTPSPTRPSASETGTPFRGQSVVSGREGTVPPTAALTELPATSYIPVEMLDFPPNSLEGLAVGWHMNGGKRVWSKRIIRGREKFTGKWRNWMLDGTRDLAEMEDLPDWFADKKLDEDETSLRKIDWKRMRKEPPWWEVELGGPLGQPPVPFTGYPKPHPLRHRELGVSDWGIYPEVDAESRILASQSKQPEHVAMSEHLRPAKHRYKPPIPNEGYFANHFDGHLDTHPGDVLGQTLFGDVTGEAYSRSVRAFLEGAMDSAGYVPAKKTFDPIAFERPLERFVRTQWRGGLFSHDHRSAASKTLIQIQQLRTRLKVSDQPANGGQQKILEVAQAEYGRRALQYLARTENQLDITPLLHIPADFMYAGMGGKASTKEGIEWVGAQLSKGVLGQGSSTIGNNPLKRKSSEEDEAGVKKAKISSTEVINVDGTAQTIDPTSEDGENAEMKKLRLELVALCKFYPLAALAKMKKEDAERLLPVNVRPLMTKK